MVPLQFYRGLSWAVQSPVLGTDVIWLFWGDHNLSSGKLSLYSLSCWYFDLDIAWNLFFSEQNVEINLLWPDFDFPIQAEVSEGDWKYCLEVNWSSGPLAHLQQNLLPINITYYGSNAAQVHFVGIISI